MEAEIEKDESEGCGWLSAGGIDVVVVVSF